jgi:protein disulfide-isomerase A6
MKLNKDNLQTFIECVEDKTKPTIILFYADWCPHCQAMKPAWGGIKRKYAKNKKVNLFEVEHQSLDMVPKKYKKIQGFPTIQTIKGGKLKSEYYGNRSKEDIDKYIKEQS